MQRLQHNWAVLLPICIPQYEISLEGLKTSPAAMSQQRLWNLTYLAAPEPQTLESKYLIIWSSSLAPGSTGSWPWSPLPGGSVPELWTLALVKPGRIPDRTVRELCLGHWENSSYPRWNISGSINRCNPVQLLAPMPPRVIENCSIFHMLFKADKIWNPQWCTLCSWSCTESS